MALATFCGDSIAFKYSLAFRACVKRTRGNNVSQYNSVQSGAIINSES